MFPNWQGNASPTHFNRQYPQAPQQWGNRLPGPPVMGAPVQSAQWDHRYPPQNAQPPYPGKFLFMPIEIFLSSFSTFSLNLIVDIFVSTGNQVQPPQWAGMNQSPMGNAPNAIRPPQRGPIPGKNIPGGMPPPQAAKTQVAPFPSASPAKRDIVFPSTS